MKNLRRMALAFLMGAAVGNSIWAGIANDSVVLQMDDEIITDFEKNLDSLSDLEYIDDTSFAETNELIEIDSATFVEAFADIPDSVFIARLGSIPTTIDLSYNKIVRRFIEVYLTQRRETVQSMLGLANYYFPVFDDIFDYYDIPNEMKYMSIIESALNPRAVSRAGAVGLWQFMYGTGRMCGLTINSLVDERRDPLKSTHAAATYAKKLYGYYGDWLMVIAAYNCGPGNVNKAIRRSGGKKNYWDIYYYLPRETRGHVPAFIAANYVMNFYHLHNLQPSVIDLPHLNDTIMVLDELHLEQVAHVLDIPLTLLRDMNPQYRADILPATPDKPCILRLPEHKTLEFIDLQNTIFAYNDSVYFNPHKNLNQPVQYTAQHTPSGNQSRLTYTVKSGDNLGYISEWYNVRISDIKYWNNLRKNTIFTGQKLVIYVPKNKHDQYYDINQISFAEKQRRAGNAVPQNAKGAEVVPGSKGEYFIYTVKNGDTLWEIAQQFPGVSDTDIMRLNNISNASKIHPGQKLKIKKEI
jgi:membrane-bound lytic murein transglycosylase D